MAFSAQIRMRVSVGDLATVTLQNAVSYEGVTFSFDRPMPVGQFVTGEPFVVSSESFGIVSITPASGDIQGDGSVGHGTMKDPYTGAQGFDDYIATSSVGGMRFGNTSYSAALNVDPGNTGSPISIATGEETSIVKSVRRASVTSPESWQTIEKYIALHVLSSAPFVDAYPPSECALTKTLWRRNARDLSIFRSLQKPASFTKTYAQARAEIPRHLGMFGATGERLRRFRLDSVLGTANSNYSANVAAAYWRYMMLGHFSGTTIAQREEIADQIIRFAIHLYGLTTRGWNGAGGLGSGAGQQHGFHNWLYMGAFLLGDTGMLEAAKTLQSGMVSMHLWASDEHTGFADGGDSGTISQVFFAEQEGVPFILPSQVGSNVDTRYGVIGGTASARELMPVLALQNGPSGENGATALLDGGVFDTTNPRAASIAFLDRYRTWTPWVMGSENPGQEWSDIWDLIRPLTGLTPWSGRPDQIPYGTASGYDGDDQFRAVGAGQVSWNFAGYDYATETVTGRDIRYSLDGVQWIEMPDVAESGVVSGLMQGVSHQFGIRLNSASGTGPWSINYDYSGLNNPPDRGVVTVGGVLGTAVPAFAVTPAVQVRLHPGWPYALWKPVAGLVDEDDLILAAGVGYQEAGVYPAPSYGFQWRRNGAPVPGAVLQTYLRKAADAGAELSCEVTATNGAGSSATAITAPVTIPALNAPPVGTLIDTNFTGRFVVDYEADWATATGTGADHIHLPDLQFPGLGVSKGAIRCRKTSSYPDTNFILQRPLVPGTTYQVLATILAGYAGNWAGGGQSGTAEFVLRIPGVTDYVNRVISQTTQGQVNVVDIDETFTVPANATNLALTVRVALDSAFGGSGGGDIYMTRLRISPV